ncbi:hypothetical protein [Amycolatopsis solani]|nr:hypothetical protein [Amycolatopsis sp. MEP2-6]
MISFEYVTARIADVQHEFAVARRWRRRIAGVLARRGRTRA